MPTEKLPPFLEDEAHSLRVTWRKSINYFTSFTQLWFEAKARLESGEFDDRRKELRFHGPIFDAWAAEIGLPSEFIHKLLKAHEAALAEEHRQKINLEIILKRKQRREAAEQREAERAEKQLEKEQDRKARELEEKRKRRIEFLRQRRIALIRRGPQNSHLSALLASTAFIQDSIHLGNCYFNMREVVNNEAAGKDEQSHPWTWRRWVEAFIVENPDPNLRREAKLVNELIKGYMDSKERANASGDQESAPRLPT